MASSFRMRAFACAAALAAISDPAAAAVYTFDLTGNVASGSTFNFTIGNLAYTVFSAPLAGTGTPVDLAAGDVLNIHVALDSLVNVAPSSAYTFLGVNADTTPTGFGTRPGGLTSESMLTPFNGAFAGQTFTGACANCANAALFVQPGPAFSISEFDATVTIIDIVSSDPNYSGPITLSGFSFSYQLTDYVPEPATWATMIAGFALAGIAFRRRAVRPHQAA